jgi:hypothetical protein
VIFFSEADDDLLTRPDDRFSVHVHGLEAPSPDGLERHAVEGRVRFEGDDATRSSLAVEHNFARDCRARGGRSHALAGKKQAAL